MADELAIVQFPHPGSEHKAAQGTVKPWNTGDHARKFLRARGKWLDAPDLSTEPHADDLVFWGEWEPQSLVLESYPPKAPGWPKHLHAPFWVHPPDANWRQNTDPFVFGQRFLYSNCRQNSKTGPRRTQRLENGSVILFGSTLHGQFVLDTVFVCSDSQPMSENLVDDLADVDETFKGVVAGVLYTKDDHRQFRQRLYAGATPSHPSNETFSFFPCLPYADAPQGFPRPSLALPGIVNPRSSRNTKFTSVDSIQKGRRVWSQVAEQVLDQGLFLGVQAESPPLLGSEAEAYATFAAGQA